MNLSVNLSMNASRIASIALLLGGCLLGACAETPARSASPGPAPAPASTSVVPSLADILDAGDKPEADIARVETPGSSVRGAGP